MTPTLNPSSHTVVNLAGLRIVALEHSDYLFLERKETAGFLSVHVARDLAKLESLTSKESVCLLDENDRLEALVDLAGLADIEVRDFASIRTVGLSPQLGHRLGRWMRHERLNEAWWSVELQPKFLRDDEIQRALQSRILQPWVERSRSRVFLSHSASERARISEPLMAARRSLLEAINTLEQHSTARSQQQAVAIRATARKALKSAKLELEKCMAALPSTRDAGATSKPSNDQTARASDPVQTAIEIRERLQQAVPLLDAATWAKWRGVKSNPSAALGKYKRQGRVFAIQSGNRDLYAAFQFDEDAEPRPVIKDVLKIIPEDARGWSLLSWFDAKNVLLNGRKPSEVLASDAAAVLSAAARFYSRED